MNEAQDMLQIECEELRGQISVVHRANEQLKRKEKLPAEVRKIELKVCD